MAEMTEPIPGTHSFGRLAPLLTSPRPIFNGLKAETVVQQLVTNCPLPALLAAMAHAMPGRLRAMIAMETLPSPRSSFFLEERGVNAPKTGPGAFQIREIYKVAFQHKTIEVSPILFMSETAGKGSAGGYAPRFAMSTDGGGWVSYIEKAYVAYRCRFMYSNLDFTSQSDTPLTVARVVEDVARDFDWFRLSERRLWLDPEPFSPDPPPGHEQNEEFVVPEDDPRTPRNESGERILRSTKGLKRRLRQVFREHHRRATIVTTHNHTLAVVGFRVIAKNRHDQDEVTLYDPLRNAKLPAMKMPIFLSAHDAVYQVR